MAASAAAFQPTQLVSTARNAAVAGLDLAKTMSVPAALVVAAAKSREFAVESLPQATVQSSKWIAANPGTAVAYGAVGIGLVCIAQPVVVAAPALAAAGFGSGGIITGSTAAGIHSGIGSVLAPSLFATLQSAGMGGYGAATVYGAVQGAGCAIVSSAGGALAWTKAKV